jgi:hypothetical protein
MQPLKCCWARASFTAGGIPRAWFLRPCFWCLAAILTSPGSGLAAEIHCSKLPCRMAMCLCARCSCCSVAVLNLACPTVFGIPTCVPSCILLGRSQNQSIALHPFGEMPCECVQSLCPCKQAHPSCLSLLPALPPAGNPTHASC